MKQYFLVGIKGAAMSNLAIILQEMGNRVSGCDISENFITDPVLSAKHIPIATGFDPIHITEHTDMVIYSAAHAGENNPVVTAAKKRGIPAVSQAQFLGDLMDGFSQKLAVAGCHGKTTTSSLLAYSLIKLNADPSYLVGTPFFNGYPGGHYGKADYFVIEADEYGVNPPVDKTPKLLHLRPTRIICTNIDFDHPDVYRNIAETKSTFLRFFKGKKIYGCLDDENLRSVLPQVKNSEILTYGFSADSDMRIFSPRFTGDESFFNLSFKNKDLGIFGTRLPGTKNILNVTGVVLLLMDLGFDVEKIRTVVRGFSSVKRRFELVFTDGRTMLFDDYAHHPAEISAVIEAARNRFPGKRIIAIFQPHTYSRTEALKQAFVKSLAAADISLIAPIFASAREQQQKFTVSSVTLQEEAQKQKIHSVYAFEKTSSLIKVLKNEIRAGDVIFTIGAGDIYKLKDDIIHIISGRH